MAEIDRTLDLKCTPSHVPCLENIFASTKRSYNAIQ